MKSINWETIRQIDLIDYLAFLGHHPDIKMSRNREYWYLSPLPGRNERTPSFKVDRRKNLWYDHGLGKGGSIIDFCLQYHGCNIHEALNKLQGFLSFHRGQAQAFPLFSATPSPDEKKKIRIVATGPIQSPALISYLEQRKIPLSIAQNYCREVQYELGDKKYYSIGFPNNAGGFELRNAHFKGSAAPKDITFFDNGKEDLYVFEGFFNFLSFTVIRPQTGIGFTNCLVLNSLAFFEKSRSLMEQHNKIFLLLDRDLSGRQNTQKALSWNQEMGLAKYTDSSDLYKSRDDLNAWLMDGAKQQEQQRTQRGRGL
ncbi:CHC2 zinc finger domain-containing protein [Niabella drilacis]|uniref:CHC2 zinc finger n=1 Tax=Niabella drilacis (strain DSM 25811 / CCM 8410 / CCUG 62505 / LMG 26954 / E90) TaxID=1285928 RepID=A0A1G6QW31_NIADE|nr:toprim domain-containing protein [Niabella drilacis]SDC96590.1 CHC2 zinc finger [Niabella drilacis]